MTSRPQFSRHVVVSLATAGLVVAGAVLFSLWPRQWEIAQLDAAMPCLVSRGQSRSEIDNKCGVPTRFGNQPKVANGWTTFCSAPCELRGRYLLFYDCNTNLAQVETITEGYQAYCKRVRLDNVFSNAV